MHVKLGAIGSLVNAFIGPAMNSRGSLRNNTRGENEMMNIDLCLVFESIVMAMGLVC